MWMSVHDWNLVDLIEIHTFHSSISVFEVFITVRWGFSLQFIFVFVLELHIVFFSSSESVFPDRCFIWRQAGSCLLKPEAAGMVFEEAQCCYKSKGQMNTWTLPETSRPETDAVHSDESEHVCCICACSETNKHFGGKTPGFFWLHHYSTVNISE